MAATVSNLGRGNYVLGGLGAVRGPSAADAMIENQQEARAAREAELLAQQRRQQMQLAQSAEARAQATFAQQQEAYRRQQAAAAAARAQQQRTFAEFTQSLQEQPAGLTIPTAFPVGAPLPTGMQLPPPTFDALPQVFDTPEDEAYRLQRGGPAPVPGVRPMARPERPVAPVRTGAPPRIEGAGGVDALGGGAGADTLPAEAVSRFRTSDGRVISLDALVPSYRPVFEQGLAAGPDPVHTHEGGDDYFVYSDGRVFDVENALSGGDPFDVPANVQDRLRARVGVTAAPATPAAPAAPVTPAAPAAPVTPVTPELQAGLERAAQDPALTPEQRRAAAIQKQTLDAAAAVGNATVDMVTDAAALLQTLGTGLIEYGIGVPLSVASPELGARVFDQTADWYRTADELARMGEPLAPPAAAPATAGAPETSAPPAPEPEVAGMFEAPDQLVTPEGDSIAGLTLTDRRDPVAGTEAAARAAPQRDISQYFMANPNLTLDLHMQLARERQMLEARLRYAEATQNISLYEQTFSALNSRERVVNENLIEGQIAILAAQQDNFGPLQEFMDRARPNDNVELIPYTNGTVAFFVNGQEDGEPIPVADLLEGLARTFNTEYREALAAAAAQEAEREQFLFENALIQQLQAAREISVAQAKALAEMEVLYGRVDPVGDLPSGDKLFQVFTPERGYVQFRIVEAGQPLVNGQPAPAATVEEVPQVSPLR